MRRDKNGQASVEVVVDKGGRRAVERRVHTLKAARHCAKSLTVIRGVTRVAAHVDGAETVLYEASA